MKVKAYEGYYKARNVNLETEEYTMLESLKNVLPKDKNARILDIGCGGGGELGVLKKMEYKNLSGIDLSPEAIKVCDARGDINCYLADASEFLKNKENYYDFITMNHVLEHIEKNEIIKLLLLIRSSLRKGGRFYCTVPNAQSNTGSYWAYEDFTHTTLFTTGSLHYVLSMADFSVIKFCDLDNLENTLAKKRYLRFIFKKVFLLIYKYNIFFWNIVTGSSYHKASKQSYGYEIKVISEK